MEEGEFGKFGGLHRSDGFTNRSRGIRNRRVGLLNRKSSGLEFALTIFFVCLRKLDWCLRFSEGLSLAVLIGAAFCARHEAVVSVKSF